MRTRSVTVLRLLALVTSGALLIGVVQAAGLPGVLPSAYAAEGVTLSTPTLLHGNGARLSWSRYTS